MMTADGFRYLFAAILNPFFLSLLLMALSIIWLWLDGDSRLVRGCLLLSFMMFFLFSTGWVPSMIMNAFEKQNTIVTEPNPAIHWVVVFGGGHDAGNVPANDVLTSESITRLVEGVRLYRQLPRAKLLLSGGALRSTETISEAAYLARIVSWFDIPKNNIVLETDSFNTADEAVALKQIVHHEPFYLVTSAVHMPRAMALCRQQGLSPIAAPADFMSLHANKCWEDKYLPNPKNFNYSNTAWHEVLGLVWGKLRGLL